MYQFLWVVSSALGNRNSERMVRIANRNARDDKPIARRRGDLGTVYKVWHEKSGRCSFNRCGVVAGVGRGRWWKGQGPCEAIRLIRERVSNLKRSYYQGCHSLFSLPPGGRRKALVDGDCHFGELIRHASGCSSAVLPGCLETRRTDLLDPPSSSQITIDCGRR